MCWEDWTPCEMYGHYFEDGWCRDCGEREEGEPMCYVSAVPAYGRDYQTPEEVLDDWMNFRDFRVMDLMFQGYVNREDLPEGTTLNIRYDQQREVLPVNRDGAVSPTEEGE
jgi:hypothetical protein